MVDRRVRQLWSSASDTVLSSLRRIWRPADLGLVAANPSISADRRMEACRQLIEAGRFDEAGTPLRELAQIASTAEEARRLRQISRWSAMEQFKPHRLVPGRGSDGGLEVSPGAHLMISRCPGARKVLFVFTGLRQNFWLTLYVIHRSLAKEGCHIVYLRETRRQFYLGGIEGAGEDYQASVGALRQVMTALDAEQSYCIGISVGGYAALRYGLDLHASGVIGFGPAFVDQVGLRRLVYPRSTLRAVTRSPRRYVRRTVWTFKNERHLLAGHIWRTIRESDFPRSVLRKTQDLRTLYDNAGSRPDVILVYGDAHEVDRKHCRHLEGVRGVTLHPLPECDSHQVLRITIASGEFKSLIGALLASGAK